MRLKILCICQPLQPDSVNVPLCSRFEARPFPARSPQPVCRPFGLVLQQGLERSNTSLPVSDPLLLGLITKLAFPPGALLAGLTQWGQGRLPFSFICGRRCSSPVLLLPSPVGVKVWENSNAAIANSLRFARLSSDGRPTPAKTFFAQPAKKVRCHCQPVVLQNNHLCWHLPGVFPSLCTVHHLDRWSDWLADYPIAFKRIEQLCQEDTKIEFSLR